MIELFLYGFAPHILRLNRSRILPPRAVECVSHAYCMNTLRFESERCSELGRIFNQSD